MTKSTKFQSLFGEDSTLNTLTPKPIHCDIPLHLELSSSSAKNLGRLTQILFVATGIKVITFKNQAFTLSETIRVDGLLPLLLAGTAENQIWDNDLIIKDSALLGYQVSLVDGQNLLDKVIMIHDNIKELLRLGGVSSDDNEILCIDPLIEHGQAIKADPGQLPSSLALQSNNLTIAKDAILVASSQVSCNKQTTQLQ